MMGKSVVAVVVVMVVVVMLLLRAGCARVRLGQWS
jgi:hypothetical protein